MNTTLGSGGHPQVGGDTINMTINEGTEEGSQDDDDLMIPDDQAMTCSSVTCKMEFNFFFRRHHCDICRKVFCKNCSLQT